jgi:hypothetical protein
VQKTTGKQGVLAVWEIQQAHNARNRALIMQILNDFPQGLTTQQIIAKEQDYYSYTFLTDNRLRELKAKGWVRKTEDAPARWISLKEEA